MRDWFDEWLDSPSGDEGYGDEYDEDRPRPTPAEIVLMAALSVIVLFILAALVVAVLVILIGGIVLITREFGFLRWVLVIAVFCGFMYWDKKASERK
jgi:hypothetical protein